MHTKFWLGNLEEKDCLGVHMTEGCAFHPQRPRKLLCVVTGKGQKFANEEDRRLILR
jgi:hypothetical protein